MRRHPIASNRATGATGLPAAVLLALASQAAPAGAQVVTPVMQNRAWAEQFGGLGNDAIQALAPRSDGGLFFAGRSSSFVEAGDDLWVGRLDRRGRTIWEVTLGINDSDDGLALLATPDGGCLVAGATNTFATVEGGEGWIIKLDASGGVTWQKTYGSLAQEHIRSLALSLDGYYAAGTITDDLGDDPWVLEIDPDGNILWQERFPGAGFDIVASLTATDAGVALLCASNSEFPTVPGVPFIRPWLLNLDGDGNVLWQRVYNVSGGDYLSEIVALEGGGFIATGEVLSAAFFRGDVWVLRLDAAGAVVWDRRFGDNFGNLNFDGGLAVRPTAEGGFAVFASTLTAQDGLWMLQLDGAGNRLWDRSYGLGLFQNATAFAVAANGDRLLAGTFPDQIGNADAFVLRLTPKGRPGPGCELSSPTDPNEWGGVPESDLVTLDPEPTFHVTTETKAIALPVSSGRFLCNSVGG
jgi:hypothetical protein